jgi:hypothetical protein
VHPGVVLIVLLAQEAESAAQLALAIPSGALA